VAQSTVAKYLPRPASRLPRLGEPSDESSYADRGHRFFTVRRRPSGSCSSSWSYRMSDAAWLHFGGDRTPHRGGGPCSRCGKRFPGTRAPRYLLRESEMPSTEKTRRHDRDMGMRNAYCARSPWQIRLRTVGAPSDASAWTRYGVEPEIVASDPAKLFFYYRSQSLSRKQRWHDRVTPANAGRRSIRWW